LGSDFIVRPSRASDMGEAPYITRRTMLRSNSSAHGESTTSWIIVGTSSRSVTTCSWTAVRTATGSNTGIVTWVPPTTPQRAQPEKAAAWNIGAACRSTPPGGKWSVASPPMADVSRLPWLSRTP
jgi:hypothetical protein